MLSYIDFSRKKIIYGIALTILLLLVWMAGNKLLDIATAHTIAKPTLFFISRISFWIYLLAIIWYAHRQEKSPLLLWQEKRYSILYTIGSIVLLYLFIGFGAVVISNVLKMVGLLQRSSKVDLILKFSLSLKLLAVVTAAVCEELIFRGYLLARLQLVFTNKHLPVIISALVFGLPHAGYGTVVNTVIPVFIGLVFGYHYQKYRSITILVACHFLIDFISVIFSQA